MMNIKKIQDGIAMLHLLSFSRKDMIDSNYRPIEETFHDLDERIKQKYL